MHRGPSTCVHFDENGRLYSGGYDCRVVAFQPDGRTVRWVAEHDGLVNSVHAGPTLVASVGADRVVRLWDRETGQARGPPLGPRPDDLNVVFLDPLERYVVVAGDEGRMSAYATDQGNLLWERYCAPPSRYGESIEAAAWLPGEDGRNIYFAADNSGHFAMVDQHGSPLMAGSLLDFGLEILADIECAADDPVRREFLLGTACGSLVHMSLDNPASVRADPVHSSAVKALVCAADQIICTSYDNTMLAIDANTGARRSTFLAGDGRRGWARGLAADPANVGRLASTSLGTAPQLWRAATLDLLADDAPATSGVNALASLRGKIFAGADDGYVWAVVGHSSHRISHLDSMVLGLAAQPNGFLIAACSHDGACVLLDAGNGATLARTVDRGDPAVCCAFSPDGRQLAVGHYSGKVRIRCADDLSLLGELTSSDTIKSLAFLGDGDRLAAGIANGTLEVWALAPMTKVASVDGLFLVNSVAHDASTNSLITVGRDRIMRRWSADLQLEGSWIRHSRSIKTVAVSPDGRWIATSGYDAKVGVWDAQGRGHLYDGHLLPGVASLLWLDSIHLVSGGWDGTVRIWTPGVGELQRVALAA